jgi:secondary thiamine-phosphate synthase enzyme
MAVRTKTIQVKSGPDLEILDITDRVRAAVRESGLKAGNVTIFVPGSTASVTTTEFEPNLNRDLKSAVERLVPSDLDYEHHKTWGDENGKSHVRASLFGPGITVPFTGGKLILGSWQQIVLLDFDVPARSRDVVLQIMGE